MKQMKESKQVRHRIRIDDGSRRLGRTFRANIHCTQGPRFVSNNGLLVRLDTAESVGVSQVYPIPSEADFGTLFIFERSSFTLPT